MLTYKLHSEMSNIVGKMMVEEGRNKKVGKGRTGEERRGLERKERNEEEERRGYKFKELFLCLELLLTSS